MQEKREKKNFFSVGLARREMKKWEYLVAEGAGSFTEIRSTKRREGGGPLSYQVSPHCCRLTLFFTCPSDYLPNVGNVSYLITFICIQTEALLSAGAGADDVSLHPNDAHR